MEFCLALREIAKREGFSLEGKNADVEIARKYKSFCETKEDFIQLQEYKSIVDATDEKFANVLYQAYKKGEGKENGYSELLEEIKKTSENLDKCEISCFTYSYYISGFLDLFKELYGDEEFKSLNIEKVKWQNPLAFDYTKKASLTSEATFGVGAYKETHKNFLNKGTIITGFKGKSPNVIIPRTVTSIGEGAFKNNSNIKAVFIPETVTQISKEAFSGCENLEMVVLPKDLRKLPDSCFSNCIKLEKINLENVIEIGKRCFENCESLKNEESGDLSFYALKTVYEEAFFGCTGITNHNFISQLEKIGKRAFYGSKLKKVVLEKCKTLSKEAFLGCTGIEVIEISSTPRGIGGFSGCTGVKEIYLNSKVNRLHRLFYNDVGDFSKKINKLEKVFVKELTKGQFHLCENVKHVEVKDSKSVPMKAFYGCKNLESVKFLSPIDSIGESAFAECESLKTIDMTFKGTSISDTAFYKCSRLENIEEILRNVTSIGKRALAYTDLSNYEFKESYKKLDGFCFANAKYPANLNELDLRGMTPKKGAFHGVDNLRNLKVQYSPNIYEIFDKTKEEFSKRRIDRIFASGAITKDAFSGYSSVRYISFDPPKDKEIPQNAFSGCTSLESVKANGKVTKIGKYAFKDCVNLAMLDPETIEELDEGAFYGCKNASKIMDMSSVKRFGKYSYAHTDLKELDLKENVEYIAEGTFCGCDGLTKVTLPFVGTGKNAGKDERCLETIFAKKKDGVKGSQIPTNIKEVVVLSDTLPENAFSGASHIEKVSLPNLKAFTNSYFDGCTELKSVSVGSSLEKISPREIRSLEKTASFIIPEDSENFHFENGSIFSKDKKELYYLNNKDSWSRVKADVKSVKEYAVFKTPHSLEILENVNYVQKNAFNCQIANELLISNASNIEPGAFYNCSGLESVSVDKVGLLKSLSYGSNRVKIKSLSIKNVALDSISQIIYEENPTIEIDRLIFDNSPILNQSYFKSVSSVNSLAVLNAELLGSESLSTLNVKNVYLSSPQNKSCELLNKAHKYESVIIDGADISGGYFDGLTIGTLILKNIGVISKDAFRGAKIDSLTIDSVSSIEPLAFRNSKIANATSNDKKYVLQNGILYANGALIYCFNKEIKELSIPYDVRLVMQSAFEDTTSLYKVTVSSEDIYFDKEAFTNCHKISTLEIPNIKNKTLGEAFFPKSSIKYVMYTGSYVKKGFFSKMTGLKEVILNGTEKVYDLAFSGCTSLEGVKGLEKVSLIGDMAFYSCKELRAANISPSCEYVGLGAFEGCSSLRSITYPISDMEIKYNIKAQDHFGASRTNEISLFVSGDKIPANYFNKFEGKVSVLGTPKEIGESAFEGTLVEAVSLEKIEKIERKAFFESGIKLANMPNVKKIGDYAFSMCERLTSVKINENVEEISKTWLYNSPAVAILNGAENGRKYKTVSGCLILDSELIYCAPKNQEKKIDLSSSVTKINKNALLNSEVEELDISSVTALEENLLITCKKLKSLKISSLKGEDGKSKPLSYFANNKLKEIYIKSASLVDGCFDGFHNLKTISIEKPLAKIPKECFRGCVSLEILPPLDGVTSIGLNAFVGCDSIKKLILPYLGKTIKSKTPMSYLFGESNYVKDVEILDGEIIDGAFKGSMKLHTVTLPCASLKIPDNCFEGCQALKTVKGCDGVTEIGKEAFKNCSELEKIEFNNVTEIGDHAFYGCIGLKTVKLGSSMLAKIGSEIFMGVSSIESLTINLNEEVGSIKALGIGVPNLLREAHLYNETIYKNAFAKCARLKKVTSDKKVTTVEESAFMGCTSLESSEILKDVKEIGERAFESCSAFTAVNIKNATSLGKKAFYGCKSVKEVVLSNGLKTIPAEAFAECTSLAKINVPESIRRIDDYAFAKTAMKNVPLKMPKSLEMVGKFLFNEADSPIVYIRHGTDMKNWDDNWDRNCKVHFSLIFKTKRVKTKKY